MTWLGFEPFQSEDGGGVLLRNFGELLSVYKALHPKVSVVRTSNPT
jgi:hypothetical protein